MECEFYLRKLDVSDKDRGPHFDRFSKKGPLLLSSPDDTHSRVPFTNDFENYVSEERQAHHLVDNLKKFSSTTNQLIDKNNGTTVVSLLRTAGLRKKDLRYNVEQIVICPRCQAL